MIAPEGQPAPTPTSRFPISAIVALGLLAGALFYLLVYLPAWGSFTRVPKLVFLVSQVGTAAGVVAWIKGRFVSRPLLAPFLILAICLTLGLALTYLPLGLSECREIVEDAMRRGDLARPIPAWPSPN